MGKIKQWLKKNGQLALDNMAENKRFVFHRLVDAEGPVGAQGVPLRAGRSLAGGRRTGQGKNRKAGCGAGHRRRD